MFDRLDDQAPPEPTEEGLRDVRARFRHHRSRRIVSVAGATALAVLVLGGTAFSLGRDDSPSVAVVSETSTTTPPTTRVPTTLPGETSTTTAPAAPTPSTTVPPDVPGSPSQGGGAENPSSPPAVPQEPVTLPRDLRLALRVASRSVPAGGELAGTVTVTNVANGPRYVRIGSCGLKFFVNLVKADWETGPTSHLPCDPNPALLAAGESRDYPVTVPTGTDMVEWIDGGWVNVPMSPGDYLARIVVRGGLTIPPGVPVTITPAP